MKWYDDIVDVVVVAVVAVVVVVSVDVEYWRLNLNFREKKFTNYQQHLVNVKTIPIK